MKEVKEMKELKNEPNKIIAKIINEFSEKFQPVFIANAIEDKYELILVQKTNLYLVVRHDMNELDLKCAILEWLSRDASKGGSYSYEKLNEKYQNKVLSCINNILGTSFSHEDIDKIYTYLGNKCNHEKTIKFILQNYDLNVLNDN